MVKSISCSKVLLTAAEPQKPGSRPGDKEERETPPAHGDDDTLGLVDPFLESFPLTPDGDTDDACAEATGNDIAIDELVEPRDLGASELEQDALDVPMDLLSEDDHDTSRIDDEQGPDFMESLAIPETSDEELADSAEEGPVESPFVLESATTSARELADVEGEGTDNEPIGLYVDDAELPWAKEHWTERALGLAFSARRHLALVGSTLCVAGDTTHLHDTKNDAVLEELPLAARTTRIVALDPEAKELLLLTATGQLLTFKRQATDPSGERSKLVTESMVSNLWQLAPGVPVVLVQCENGQLYDYADSKLCTHTPPPMQEGSRLIALSSLGEPRISLWKSAQELQLCIEASGDNRRVPLPKVLERAISATRPCLLGFNESVLVGVREHGLWLHRIGTREFSPIPGCRSFTAATAGHFGLRPTAFVGLFSELDDRAEIAMIDLSTGRATRIAELSIHSDYTGREDDPPELARIDALVWDGNNGQLWAAGAFGLARFTPPLGPKSS